MKSVAVIALALACVFGVAFANFGLGGYPAQSSGGFGGLMPLLLLLLLVPLLFNNNSSSGGGTTILYGNFSGPTGGK